MSRSSHFTKRKVTKIIKDTASFNSEISNLNIKIEPNIDSIPISKITKPKRKRTIKHIKLETEDDTLSNNNINTPIPNNFFPIYNKIKEMRKLIITPVDLVGCIRIPLVLKYITQEYKKSPNLFKPLKIEDLPNIQSIIDKFKIENSNDRYQLLVTLMFSSQTKDEINFIVMQNLHLHYLRKGYENGLCMESIISTSESEIDSLIFQIGFHKRKSSYLLETTNYLINNYNSDIPNLIENLINLKGIGYKMGNLILQGAWNITTGISVDTHMVRLCNMFGWYTKDKNPENIRKYLESMLINHKEIWNEINPVLVGFGQSICTPTSRRCDLCLLSTINKKNNVICPAIDKRLLLRLRNGVDNNERKIRGDLANLIDYINS